jgi:multiple sugar transport system permease protein
MPFGFLLLVVDVAPLILGVISSMKDLNLHTLQYWLHAPWDPVTNYSQAASGAGGLPISGWVATWQTVEYSVLATVISVPLAILAALTVSQRRSRATTAARIVYMLPAAMPLFSTAFVWRMILSPGYGLIDQLRKLAGLGTRPNNLLIGGHSFATLVGVDVWFAWAFIYLFVLAGLQNISRELYEAATLDRASGWQKFRYVIWPSLQRVLLVAIVLSTINHYNDFTLPFVLFGNSPPTGAVTVPVATYLAGFSLFNFGLADALAVIGLAGIIVPVLAYVWIAGGSKLPDSGM